MLKVTGKLLLFILLILAGARSFAQYADVPVFHADMQRGPNDPLPFMLYRYDSGYMHRNLVMSLKDMLIVNPNLMSLFANYRNLQAQNNVALPKIFQALINFSYRFMKAHSKPETEKQNGVKHDHLSFQFIRASFCFGNDPFMVLAKINRESSFNRTLVSSGSAVGFTQMTGSGIKEVQHQMSGNNDISMPGVRDFFKKAIGCFTGNQNYTTFMGGAEAIKTAIRNDWKLDIIYGQILLKTYVAYTNATASRGRSQDELTASYAESLIMYNGDKTEVEGRCMGARVPMRQEYSCDIMKNFDLLTNQWQFQVRNSRMNLT